MNIQLSSFLGILLFSLSSLSFADRILISGKPLVLRPYGEYYSFPRSYHASVTNYHFVFVGGVYRVCHLNPLPISDVDVIHIRIALQNQIFYWNCYAKDPRFFEIDY